MLGNFDRGPDHHRTAQDSTGQDRTAPNSTGQHKTAQDSTGQHRTRQDSTGQHRKKAQGSTDDTPRQMQTHLKTDPEIFNFNRSRQILTYVDISN